MNLNIKNHTISLFRLIGIPRALAVGGCQGYSHMLEPKDNNTRGK